MSKIDITSTAVEKGIEAAKDFLGKLIGPTIEETGLLIKDKITFWRFKNQVKMINKAQKYCQENKINPKNIPLKMLHPIMEYSALEESNDLQDKWAILLSNMVDSEQNIENHVFPYILSQVSTKEFQVVESFVQDRFLARVNWNAQLNHEIETNKLSREQLEKEVEELKQKLNAFPKGTSWDERYTFQKPIWSKERELNKINELANRLRYKIKSPINIPDNELEEYEFANLRRLGIIKGIANQTATLESSDITYDDDYKTVELEDLDIVIEHDYEEYVVTQLGEIFIDVCTEKKKKAYNT